MKEIALTIDGKKVIGIEGNTVLEVCEANNIYVPTLCHLKGLTDHGGCRMCVVDIEKERRPVPACTYPARDGLVIQTHNEKLERYRRLILELMFTERNHLCAQCVASGDCELQSLAYKYQMDNTRYPYSWPALPVDSVNDYLVIDHNRCILCGRCIRTCHEVVGVHTLDFGYRGWKDMVVADLNQPLGASSCISCGACFQVCPTGAIFSKHSAYKGKPQECRKVRSICPVCGVGCEIEAQVKDDRLVRIDSPDISGQRGILCYKGRFTPLYNTGERVKAALVRNSRGELEPRPLSEAIQLVAGRLAELKAQYGDSSIAGVASSQADNQTLKAFKELIAGTIGSQLIDTLDGDNYRTISKGIAGYDSQGELNIETSLDDILAADCLVVVGANPLESHPVAGSYIARAVGQNKATLIVIDPSQNTFPYHATLWLQPEEGKEQMALDILSKTVIDRGVSGNSARTKEIAAALRGVSVKKSRAEAGIDANDLLEAADVLNKAKHGIITYGQGILRHKDPKLITSLLSLATIVSGRDNEKPRIISLKPKGNSRGAWDMGIAHPSRSVPRNLTRSKVKALYLLLSDDPISTSELPKLSEGLEFIVIQSSHLSPLTSKADVVLPSPVWPESEKECTTLDGIAKATSRLVKPPQGTRSDEEILREISKQMKK